MKIYNRATVEQPSVLPRSRGWILLYHFLYFEWLGGGRHHGLAAATRIFIHWKRPFSSVNVVDFLHVRFSFDNKTTRSHVADFESKGAVRKTSRAPKPSLCLDWDLSPRQRSFSGQLGRRRAADVASRSPRVHESTKASGKG